MLTAPDFPPDLVQPGDLELRRIYLFSKFHGTGAGRGMIELAIASARHQQASRLLLGVHPDNQRPSPSTAKTVSSRSEPAPSHVGASTFEDPVFALTL